MMLGGALCALEATAAQAAPPAAFRAAFRKERRSNGIDKLEVAYHSSSIAESPLLISGARHESDDSRVFFYSRLQPSVVIR